MRPLLVFILIASCSSLLAQDSSNFKKSQKAQEERFMWDQSPQFPGGEAALKNFITLNLVYPNSARQDRIEGNLAVEFIVEEDGNLSNFRVINGQSKILAVEAMRIAKLLPKFIPAKRYLSSKHQDTIVRSFYIMHVIFKL